MGTRALGGGWDSTGREGDLRSLRRAPTTMGNRSHTEKEGKKKTPVRCFATQCSGAHFQQGAKVPGGMGPLTYTRA